MVGPARSTVRCFSSPSLTTKGPIALQYAAAKCAFPEGAVDVRVMSGNRISEEARATMPPEEYGDFTGERAVWEGKFNAY